MADPTETPPILKVESVAPADAKSRRKVTLTLPTSPITVDLADLAATLSQCNQLRLGSGADYSTTLPTAP